MNTAYRIGAIFYVPIGVFLALSFVVGILSPIAMRDAGEGGRLAVGLTFGALSTSFLLAAIALCLVKQRHRLIVSDTSVELIGLSGTKRIMLNDAVRLRWRCESDQSVVKLWTSSAAMKIALNYYSRVDQRALIRFLRRRLPESIQEGWSEFWLHVYRLFDEPAPARRLELAAETQALRWRLFALCLTGTLLVGTTAFLVWHSAETMDLPWEGGLVPWLVYWLVFWFVICGLCCFARADRGRLQEKYLLRLKANPVNVAAIVVFLLLEVATVPLLFLGGWTTHVFAWELLVSMICLMLDLVLQVTRMKRRARAAAEEAERLYLDGPANAAALKETRR